MKNFSNFLVSGLSGTLLLTFSACSDAVGAGNGVKEKGVEAAAGQDAKRAPVVGATRVESARIEASSAELRLVRPGEVEAARHANLAAPMGGLIEKMSLEVGDTVIKGQVVAKVDSSLMAAQLQLTRVEVKDAERELDRLESMGKAVARVRVDQARTRLERTKAQARVASIQSDRTFVRAPFTATVAEVLVEKGEVVPPGGVLTRLVVLDPAVISVAVADRDVGSIEIGSRAHVSAGGVAQQIEGRVVRIDPTADLKTRSFQVEVELSNSDRRLKPGMIATVDFRQTASEEQIIIPQYFLVTRLDSNGVFVIDAEKSARWRDLKLGSVVRDQVVVESGLEVGDLVVTLGHRGLVDGDKLIVGREGVCCSNGRVTYQSAKGASAQAPEEAQVQADQAEGAAQ